MKNHQFSKKIVVDGQRTVTYHFEIREIEKGRIENDIEERKSISLGYLNFLFIHNNNLNHLYTYIINL